MQDASHKNCDKSNQRQINLTTELKLPNIKSIACSLRDLICAISSAVTLYCYCTHKSVTETNQHNKYITYSTKQLVEGTQNSNLFVTTKLLERTKESPFLLLLLNWLSKDNIITETNCFRNCEHFEIYTTLLLETKQRGILL